MGTVQIREGIWDHPTSRRRLFYRIWSQATSRILLVIVHGFGEHGGRYDSLARRLVEHDMAVACPDLWGHGRSSGRRGDIDRIDLMADDLTALTRDLVLAQAGTERVAVFGHSFGGLVAAEWVLRSSDAYACVVLQSPLFGVGFPVPRWKERLSGIARVFCPMLSLSIGLDPTWLSHDPLIVQRYRQDPLVHHHISLRGYAALQQTIQHVCAHASELATPTLVLYGAEDRVISIQACKDIAERMTCEKRVVAFPGSYHELHHEAVREDVVKQIVQWVQAHA